MWGKIVEEGKQQGLFKWVIIISYAFFLYNISYFLQGFNRIGVILTPILYGFIIAYIMNPIIKKIHKWLVQLGCKKRQEGIAIILSYIVMTIFLSGLVLIIVPKVIQSLNAILQSLPLIVPEWLEKFNIELVEFTNTIGVELETKGSVIEQIKKGITDKYNADIMIEIIFNFTMGLSSILLNLLLGLIISIYMVINKDIYRGKSKKLAYAYMPEIRATQFIQWMSKVNETFSNFIVAKMIDSIIIGILAYIGAIALGLENTILIGVIIGVTNIIPYFGPIVGAIPASIIVLMQGSTEMIIFIVFILTLQQFDGNYLGPKLMGSKLGMNSLLIIIAVIIMSGMLGIIGMFIGVPLFAIIYMLFSEDIEKKLKKKGKSIKTEDYL